MRNIDILTMCLRNLFKRKLRTILTMLGVVIGTVAIVVTVSLGLAINLRFEQQMAGMGEITVITVYNPNNMWWFREETQTDLPDLDDNAVQRFSNFQGVEAVTPIIEAELFFRSGIYAMPWSRVLGIKPEAMEAFGYQVQEGRLLQEGDSLEVVFGFHTEKNFVDTSGWSWNNDRFWRAVYDGEDVEIYVDIFNDRINVSYDRNYIWGFETQDEDFAFDDIDAPRPVRPMPVNVVGLLEEQNDWGNIDGAIFMNIDMVQRLKADAQRQEQQNMKNGFQSEDGWGGHIDANANNRRNTGYDQVQVKAVDINTVSLIREQIEAMGFPADSPTAWLESAQDTAASLQMLLGAIGVVSLFVAAIGIANTMVMSIYERTREIGVMKVIGAALSDIGKLFLIEAAMIGFFGGLFGLLFSYLVSFILNNYLQVAFLSDMFGWMGEENEAMISLITPWLSGLALLFSSIIGLVSGYFPARRAMRLSALSAIRTE